MLMDDERKTIMVVDDEKINLDILVDLLNPNYRTITAKSGDQALKRLEKSSLPDMILLDIMMPDMDGLEVCRQLKADKRFREIPVMFISVINETIDIVKAFSLGCVDFINKPFQKDEVLARIAAHMEIRRVYHENIKIGKYRALARLTVGITEELNMPLGIIETAVNMIENRVKSDDMADMSDGKPESGPIFQDLLEAVRLAKSNIWQMHHLVRRFNKLSLNQSEAIKEKTDLVTLIDRLVDLFIMNTPHMMLKIDVKDHLREDNREWTGYPDCLMEVILNLFSNAVYHAYGEDTSGLIEVEIREDDAYAHPVFVITVQDYGSGISIEHMPAIFEPFYTTNRSYGGCGLGLSIVETIVTDLFHGKVDVTSKPGEGTRFTIVIPQTITDQIWCEI